MLRRVKHCLLLPWKLPLFRTRQKGSLKLKVLRLFVVMVTAAALMTTLFSGFQDAHPLSSVVSTLGSTSSRYEHPPSSENSARPLWTMTSALGLTSSRYEHNPSSDRGLLPLPTMAPTLGSTSGRFEHKPSSNSDTRSSSMTPLLGSTQSSRIERTPSNASDARSHSLVPKFGSNSDRFKRTPSSNKHARTLPIVFPTLDSSSGLFERKWSLAQPTPFHDCKSWKRFHQHITTLMTRTSCARHYTLLILVSSAPANFKRRNLIRRTWGSDNGGVPHWKTYFLLGQTRSPIRSKLLKTENNIYGDIIRADYYEHYWNQSLKIQMAFEWAARYCKFSFLLKADDDVFVNARSLIDDLQLKSMPKKGLYMGKLHRDPIVLRHGKWRVSYEEYSGTHYPDFCSGAGFVMSYDVIECLVPLFDVMRPYRLDDVYVGMLANKLGVIALDHSGFVMPWRNYDNCDFVPNALVQHRATGACLMNLFRIHNKG
ncbi:UDP-GlcNAc:betaGal beta-1,3-N-acetylglucosaminyltransferase 7-like [Oculina patagonica]